ncbi:MAG: metallophosphoesterase family protein [Saprospiraceae bacterium]|nr:metallophosphoesterase family protein [Saprospiraceae bacterium]
MRIGLLSDTHSFLDQNLLSHFADCDEIWHAGDVGHVSLIEELRKTHTVRGVFGNIDGQEVRSIFPEELRFDCQGLDVYMIHVGGYPGRYNAKVRHVMNTAPPKLYICGHSHILKVIYDDKYKCLHMNPGACGHHGFHQIRTVLKFDIEGGKPCRAQVIELGLRGRNH